MSIDHPDFGRAIPCDDCYWLQAYELLFGHPPWDAYARASLMDFDITTQNAVNVGLGQNRGFYIYGPNGTGKSHLAAAIVRETWDDYHGGIVLMANLLDRIREAYNPEFQVVPDDILDIYKRKSMIVLDDFGAERTTRWVQETVFKLIQHREMTKNDHITIITSNLTLSQLRNYYNTNDDPLAGNRICDRIGGMCNLLRLSGKSRRLSREL